MAGEVEEVAQQPSRDQVSDAGTELEPPEPEAAPEPGSRATLALVAAIVVLVGLAAFQAAYLWGPLKDDPTVSSERPVLLSQAAHRSAVDTAAQAATRFSSRSFETYDEQVDEAAAMMTTSFAEEFRQTTDAAKEAWLAAETVVTSEVEAQAVMTASEDQVEALVFLTQYTVKKGDETGFSQFRIKVTLIDDPDQGWLVSDVETA